MHRVYKVLANPSNDTRGTNQGLPIQDTSISYPTKISHASGLTKDRDQSATELAKTVRTI